MPRFLKPLGKPVVLKWAARALSVFMLAPFLLYLVYSFVLELLMHVGPRELDKATISVRFGEAFYDLTSTYIAVWKWDGIPEIER